MSDHGLQEWRPPGDPKGQGGGDDQKVFDTVTGPNMRLSDNLIQFGAIVAGTAAGAGAGAVYERRTSGEVAGGAFLGGFGGLVLSLLLSGFVIGLVRAILAMKR